MNIVLVRYKLESGIYFSKIRKTFEPGKVYELTEAEWALIGAAKNWFEVLEMAEKSQMQLIMEGSPLVDASDEESGSALESDEFEEEDFEEEDEDSEEDKDTEY